MMNSLENNENSQDLHYPEALIDTHKFERVFSKLPEMSGKIVGIDGKAYILCKDNNQMRFFELL